MNTFDVNHFKVENNKYLFDNFVWFPLTIAHDVLICFLNVDIQAAMTLCLIRNRVDWWKCLRFQIKNENIVEYKQPLVRRKLEINWSLLMFGN